jgi:hypothetical protein
MIEHELLPVVWIFYCCYTLKPMPMNFIAKLEGFLSNFDTVHTATFPTLKIIKSKKVILQYLIDAKERDLAVGLYCPAIAEGMLLIGVEDLINLHKDVLLMMKPYDMNGVLLKRTQVKISEIKSICCFDTQYSAPEVKERNLVEALPC